MQIMLIGPASMGHPGLFVHLHAQVPDHRRFHLRRLEAGKERRRQMRESIDAYRLHMSVFFFSAPKTGKYRVMEKTEAALASAPAALSSRLLKADGSSRADLIKTHQGARTAESASPDSGNAPLSW
jgi:type VI protein secretion system component VasF